MLAAFDQVLKAHPSALLILVPRHPERFDRVARTVCPTAACAYCSGQCRSARRQDHLVTPWASCRPSAGGGGSHFVGGSLVPVGSHNLLEPARQTLPDRPLFISTSATSPPAGGPGGHRGGGMPRRLATERPARRCPCPPRDGEGLRRGAAHHRGLARTLSHCPRQPGK